MPPNTYQNTFSILVSRAESSSMYDCGVGVCIISIGIKGPPWPLVGRDAVALLPVRKIILMFFFFFFVFFFFNFARGWGWGGGDLAASPFTFFGSKFMGKYCNYRRNWDLSKQHRRNTAKFIIFSTKVSNQMTHANSADQDQTAPK